MGNKFNFYLTKKIKHFQAKRTTKRDVFSTLMILFLLIGSFLVLRNNSNASAVSLSSSDTENSKEINRVSFVGDVMLSRFMQPVYEKEGMNEIFSYAKKDWQESDHVIANLESSIVKDTEKTEFYNIDESRINFAIDEKMMIDLADESGIDTFNLANNHIADFGLEGILETLDIIEKNNIQQTGLYQNHTKIDEMYSIIDLGEYQVSVVSFSDVIPSNRGLGVRENKPGVILPNTQQSQLLKRVIQSAKSHTDLVFVYAHWGEEYTYQPSDKQRLLAQELVDVGADLIVGAHPHVLQPVELIDGVPVIYSIGNFIFDQGLGSTVSSVMMHVNTDGKRIDSIEFLPYKIVNGIPKPEESKLARQVTYRKLTKKLLDTDIKHTDYTNINIKLQKSDQ